ncbi:disease resistance protein RPP13-like isoform X2 [Arachis stenosperma]|uniref:disease resistance protein RPP13-like isoform X2 n=1 Tax=Arachis stenosperma TaxID=217475 RepID=UPI0025ABF19B|nr:disease resistance protein RPP13-like isoform X2 [Arachis stenosperma]
MQRRRWRQSRKEWVAQIRQVSIRIQDVIDLYLYKVANNDDDDHHNPRRGRRNAVAGVLCKICDLLKNCVPRHEIASEISEIRESINRLKEARQLYGDSNAGAESSGGRSSSPQRHYLGLRANFAEEEELVGIEHAKKELNNWLSEGAAARTVIAVVGEGGLGKTTLVKNVYKQEQQKHRFDCYGWVDVSRSLKGVQLFKTLLRSFHDMKGRNVDKNLHALIEDTRKYLEGKKYLIVLDDVWETELWGVVELALPKNNGMIMITTRDTGC